jgi:Uma2 family endonuclease
LYSAPFDHFSSGVSLILEATDVSNTPPGVEEAPRPFLYSFDDFERLDEASQYAGQGRRVELLLGRLVEMAPISGGHALISKRLFKALDIALEDTGLQAVPTATVKIDEASGPEPDVLVADATSPAAKYFAANEVKLAAEVAVTSLALDLGVKQKIYGSSGIPEYWVLDADAKVLHQMTAPDETGFYTRCAVLHEGDTVSPLCAPGTKIAVKDLF